MSTSSSKRKIPRLPSASRSSSSSATAVIDVDEVVEVAPVMTSPASKDLSKRPRFSFPAGNARTTPRPPPVKPALAPSSRSSSQQPPPSSPSSKAAPPSSALRTSSSSLSLASGSSSSPTKSQAMNLAQQLIDAYENKQKKLFDGALQSLLSAPTFSAFLSAVERIIIKPKEGILWFCEFVNSVNRISIKR